MRRIEENNQAENQEKKPLTKEHLDHLVLFFKPLAYSVAKRYKKNGAELDDLAHTAIIGLCHYIPQFEGDWEDLEALLEFLESLLPDYVRREARKLWRWRSRKRNRNVSTEYVEETLCDPHCEYERERLELEYRMETVLDADELEFVRERMLGLTLEEIAQSKGVNKSTISRYQRKIRKKLYPILFGLE